VSFFKGLLQLVKGGEVKVGLNKGKIASIIYEIVERSTKGFETDDLEIALKDYDIKKELKMENAGLRDFYVVTRIHSCKILRVYSAELDSTDWETLGKIKGVSEFAAQLKKSDDERQCLEITANDVPFPFAVTFALLDYPLYEDRPVRLLDISPGQDLLAKGFLPPIPTIKTFRSNETPYAWIKADEL
jgi:hypothetical protein